MLLSSYYYYYDLVHGARSRLSLAHVMPTVQVGVSLCDGLSGLNRRTRATLPKASCVAGTL
jgi:hypothetical protein